MKTSSLFFFNLTIALFLTGTYAQNNTLFTQIPSSKSGVTFNNVIVDDSEKNILIYSNFYGGAGVGIGDFNNDGLQDIYFAGNMVPDKIYLNQGNLTFKDITEQSGIKDDGGWSTSVVIADVNNDGYVDIYVTRELYDDKPVLRTNLLYINNGDETFIESAKKYGVDDSERTRQATFLDYDKDGYLDLFLATQPPNPGGYSKFSGTNLLKPEYHIKLLRNTGKNYFVDVSEESGINRTGFPNGVCASDLNNDGWTDIYVSNDFQVPDFMFINNKNGTFTNMSDVSLKHMPYYSMGVDIADINNDGFLDVFVVDMVAEDNFRLKSNMSGMNPDAFWKVVNEGGHYQYMYNTLQINNGNTTFSDIGQLTGMSATDWSWSNLIADFDNDGLKDAYITNGLLRDIRNTDADKEVAHVINDSRIKWIQKHPDGGGINTIFDILDLKKVLDLIPSQAISNYAFKNMGNYKFDKVMDVWGLDQKSFSNGAAYADLDNDGDLDLVVNNINEEAFIYRNNSERIPNSNFIRFKLSDKNNKPTFGVRVTLYQGENIQTQEVTNVRGIYSTSEPYVHFGLGNTTKVDSVVVVWPNLQQSKLYNPSINQTIKLSYDNATEAKKTLIKKEHHSGFTDYTESSTIKFKHKENNFDDYKFQVLMPHKLSEIGPALAVSDVNNDGLDDVYVGGAFGYSAVLYIQDKDGNFSKSSEELWKKEKGYEDVDALFADINGDGYQDLYVVSGGNKYEENDTHYIDRLYINDGSGHFHKEEINNIDAISGSVVKAVDYDKDGDIDLFVGGRHTPHNYPAPTSSIIFKNENGKLLNKTVEVAPELKSIGMVTDAIWADYDNDGDLDLILVGEWMPITVFENTNGKFIKTILDDFKNTSGWWFSINKGDFDNDGDMDFVVGNLGLNNKYKTSEETPFDIYYSDFDKNGIKDLVLGYYNQNEHYPLRGFSCSSQQTPKLKKEFKKYDVFASLKIDEVYGKGNLNKALHYITNTFASSYIENLGNGHFKVRPLPIQAQISNINDILVKDFNEDGNLDILTVGNLYAFEIETPRNDAGTGLLMLGDGTGGFLPKNANESGLFLNKNAKKIRTLKSGNNEFILVANNNDKLQVIKLDK